MESNRKKYIKAYYRIRPKTFKMCQLLFNSESSKELLNLAKFAKEIMKLQLYHFCFCLYIIMFHKYFTMFICIYTV